MTNSTSAQTGFTGRITVDLWQIQNNWKALAKYVRPAECAAVVKADAYGLGAAAVIPALAKAGCKTFFVATAAEAEDSRALAPDAIIYVLNGVVPGSTKRLIAANARPVFASLDDAQEWAGVAPGRPAGIQIGTGLNRLGLGRTSIEALTANDDLMAKLNLTLVMSHLACADVADDPMNAEQLRAFVHLKAKLPSAPASLAASDGLQISDDYHFDLVRPGYALYGGQATPGRRAPVRPAITAESVVLSVREVKPGETIGYAAAYKAERPMRLATIAAGYADGIARTASSSNTRPGGLVSIGGKLAPLAGRVSMDLITVDVTGFTPEEVRRGTLVELIGPNLPLEHVGAFSGTIGYEVLTRLGRRFERVYVNGEA